MKTIQNNTKPTSTQSRTRDSGHLDVLLNNKHVGIIEKTDNGKQRLVYDEDWTTNPRALPISLSMPLTKQKHSTTITTNDMWNLLPDNAVTLPQWGIEYNLSANNPLKLLAAVGEDCPGAIQLIRPGIDIAGREGVAWITEKDLIRRIKDLRADPGATRMAHDKGRVSLAGAQNKTVLYKTGDRWGGPEGRSYRLWADGQSVWQ